MNSVDHIYARLIDAASGEIDFNDAIETVVNHFDSGGGIVFELNRKTGQIGDWCSPNLVIGGDGYDEHINAINPRMRYSLRHVPGHVVCEGKFTNERAMDRSEFYDWLGQFAGFRYMLGSRLYDDGDVSVFHSVEFTRMHGHADDEKMAAFKRIAPAIGQAWKLRKRVSRIEGKASVRAWTPDHLPWATFALSRDARVIGTNSAARDLLDSQCVIELVDRQLVPLERNSDAPFRRALKQAFAGKTSEALLHDDRHIRSLIVQVLPVNPTGDMRDVPVAALVYIWDPLRQRENIGTVLGRLYGFTKAEQTLADVMASGMDLTAAGEHLKLSRNTVRNRLQSMFAKTGTRRQGEFLVKVLGILNA